MTTLGLAMLGTGMALIKTHARPTPG